MIDLSAIGNRETKPLIPQVFSKEELKILYYHACRFDIEDNNDKAEIIFRYLESEFEEIGTGTNRTASIFSPGARRTFRGGTGLIYKIALDRRGFVDSWTEFKRSYELTWCAPKSYETNMLILIQEYINLMDQEEFVRNKLNIIEICKELWDDGHGYVFTDIGYDRKNYENWGYRDNGDLCILDLGYIYPIKGNEQALTCPRCNGHITMNSTYTEFVCANPNCRCRWDFLDIRRRMNTELENTEDEMLLNARNCAIPNFHRLNEI